MKRHLLLLAALGLSLNACGKKPVRLVVNLDKAIAPGQVTITASGRVLAYDGKEMVAGTSWSAGEVPENISVEVAWQTPCGKKTATLSPSGKPQPQDGNDFLLASIDVPASLLKNQTKFFFDPGLDGALVFGDLHPPNPLPQSMTVIFDDCKRVAKISGKEVEIPEPGGGAVFLTESADHCFNQGDRLFGVQFGTCRPSSEKKLIGKMAYLVPATFDYFLAPLPTTLAELDSNSNGGKCKNSTWLNACESP